MHFPILLASLSCLLATTTSTMPTATDAAGRAEPKPKPRCWKGTSFPARRHWLPFNESFATQRNAMLFAGDSHAEIASVRAAILEYAAASGVPAALILAVIMRESSGRVDTVCGDGGRSCGIMQVQGPGAAITCTRHPCARGLIEEMVRCGTQGGCAGQTGSDLQSCAARYGGLWGAAARCYNTGSVPDPNDWTVAPYGIPQYVQDVANILLGAESPVWTRLDRECFPGQ